MGDVTTEDLGGADSAIDRAIPDPSTIEELRSLSFTYASGVDRRDRELLVSSFHADATLTVVRPDDGPSGARRTMRGHDEIGRVVELIGRYERTFHFLGQSRYELTEAGAAGEILCTAHHRWRADEEMDHTMYIRYADDYRLGDDGTWRIAARVVGVEWSETRVLDIPGTTPAPR